MHDTAGSGQPAAIRNASLDQLLPLAAGA
jgi:hypothetical protein